MIHLDTSYMIRSIAPDSPEGRQVRAWLEAGERLEISTVAWEEYLCGPPAGIALAHPDRIRIPRTDFTEEMAMVAARMYNHLGRRRGTFGDCMIAATAVMRKAALATDNPKDFMPLAQLGLRLASP